MTLAIQRFTPRELSLFRAAQAACTVAALTGFIVWCLSGGGVLGLVALATGTALCSAWLGYKQYSLLGANTSIGQPFETRLSGVHGIPIFWPSSDEVLKEKLGLTRDEADLIERHIVRAIAAKRAGREVSAQLPKAIEYTLPSGKKEQARLPRTVWLAEIKGQIHAILFTKKVFAQGGDRRIRTAYDLATGKILLKKGICGPFEEKVVNILRDYRLSRGISPGVAFVREVNLPSERIKSQMIERPREGDLNALLEKGMLSLPERVGIAYDFLSELAHVHTLEITGLKCAETTPPKSRDHTGFSTLGQGGRESAKPREHSFERFPGIHYDINPSNCLVSVMQGQRRGELCDYSFVGQHLIICQTSGYTAPEFIGFYNDRNFFLVGPENPYGLPAHHLFARKKDEFELDVELGEFNKKHGQKRDVWALGLVLLHLVMNRPREEFSWWVEDPTKYDPRWSERYGFERKGKVPPLQCLKDCLAEGKIGKNIDSGLLGLTQEVLDEELGRIKQGLLSKAASSDRASIELFFGAIFRMLRIEPNERPPAKEICEQFEAAIYPASA